MRRATAAALLPLLVTSALAGCGRDAEAPAAVEERLAEKDSMEVLEEAGRSEYEPPADGRLTERQIEMYLAVQERARAIRDVAARTLEEQEAAAREEGRELGIMDAMRALGDVGDVVTANLRAAQELGYEPAEYQWVETRVLEAWGHHMGRQMSGGMEAARQQLRAMLEEQKEQATDERVRAELERQIDELGGDQAPAEELSDAERHNLELVREHEAEIRAAFAGDPTADPDEAI